MADKTIRSIRCRPYALPHTVRRKIQEEIQEIIKTGIVRESNSSYASPMVIVKMKNGSNCICVDYREVNRITVTDPQPMTTVEDLFQKLRQYQFFSKIDLSKDYWQIPVADKTIHKNSFPDGRWAFSISKDAIRYKEFRGYVGSRNEEAFSRSRSR